MKPITNLAFYCCGVRMDDARQPQSLCSDWYAERFMDEDGMRIYDLFKDESNCNASMLVRHRIIDDMLRGLLAAEPDLCIITIGAGLDSRPYRLTGGAWFELDEPAVVEFKNARLPEADCHNPLQRISIAFCSDSLDAKLATIATEGRPVVIVMEGVFIYLNEAEAKKAIGAFHQLFPTHQLICDLVNREMVEVYGRSLFGKIESIGASFQAVDHPAGVFTENGYRTDKRISVVEKASDFGINKLPKFMLRWFFSGGVAGNAVYLFETHELYSDLVI